VICDAMRRLQQRLLNLQNVLWFQGARVSECKSFTPVAKYGLPCANVHETRRRSTALFVDLLYRFSAKLDNKCGTYRSDTNSFMYRSEVCLRFTAPIFHETRSHPIHILDIICTEYFPYWMKIRTRAILH
jgi:hypothetical protein